MEMKLLAAVADSAERAIENNVMILDNSGSVKGIFFLEIVYYFLSIYEGQFQKQQIMLGKTVALA